MHLSPFLLLSLFSHSVMSDSVTPWSIARQASLSMGFPRQEYWSGLVFPSPGDLPHPGIKPTSPAWVTWESHLSSIIYVHTHTHTHTHTLIICHLYVLSFIYLPIVYPYLSSLHHLSTYHLSIHLSVYHLCNIIHASLLLNPGSCTQLTVRPNWSISLERRKVHCRTKEGSMGGACVQKTQNWDPLGSPVVTTPGFHCRGTGLISGWGTKIPHAPQCSQK